MQETTRSIRLRLLNLIGFVALIIGSVVLPQSGTARLDPYYIVRGEHFIGIRPRVLFVLDTSGSMAWQTSSSDVGCDWSGCETDDTDRQSRIYAARKAVNDVVAATSERASYSLMTFDHLAPPSSAATVPATCDGAGGNNSCVGNCGWWAPSGCGCDDDCQYTDSCCPDYIAECVDPWNSCAGRCGGASSSGWCECHTWCDWWGDCCGDYIAECVDGGGSDDPSGVSRFAWVTEHDMVPGPWGDWDNPIPNPTGGTGTWTLCGENKPYPYLRWDDVLYGYSITNGADMPEGPLSQYVTTAQFANAANASRRVQWMPRFLGTRFHFDDCSSGTAERSIVDRSYGDYGDESNASERVDNLCDNDFYYWPFVDGFSGYSYTWLDDGTWDAEVHYGGVNERAQISQATLFSPFYLQSAHDDDAIPLAEKGPASQDDATELISGLTSPMIEGGIDAHWDTPWSAAIGNVSNHVTVGAGGNLTDVGVLASNGEFQHDTVASYLSYVVTNTEADLCVPTVAVVVTDGEPSPGFGGTTLYSNLSKLRRILGVKTYVVGFFQSGSSLTNMACAAAGSQNTTSPCLEFDNAYDWDTCRDPNAPTTNCAFLANDADALVDALRVIVDDAIDTPVPSGPGASLNEFLSGDEKVQTQLSARTEIPSFRGHVFRSACTEDEEHCEGADEPPETLEEEAFDFGGTEEDGTTNCPMSRIWNAGECLSRKVWTARRLYSHTAENAVYRISNDDGTASELFVSELTSLGLVVSDAESTAAEKADAIAAFVLGADFHEGWKLPGLANSNPVMIRRVPAPDNSRRPEVGIRDPHCAGRRLTQAHHVPASLREFATDAWRLEEADAGLDEHYEYQEAVLVGDDLGVLHAFKLDSGNELFGYVPRPMLSHVANLAANGPANFGQPAELAEHQLGLASTVNQGFIYDHDAATWRHLAVVGMGGGATEYVALDVSHMGRVDEDEPFTVLWTTESVEHEAYQAGLGETWSHPALTYVVPHDDLGQEPRAYLVFGSGYQRSGGEHEGQTLFAVDAATGEIDTGHAVHFPDPSAETFDSQASYALVNDPAVGTHCLSRFWGEAQEVYLADTAGRLFRWDLGASISGASFPHAADSGAAWSGLTTAEPLTWGTAGDDDDDDAPYSVFRACEGAGSTCTISESNRADVFAFSPAVVSSNRIDEMIDVDDLTDADKDQFLLALVSGTPFDDQINGVDPEDDTFQSSLYVMVDDHRESDRRGLSIDGIGGFVEAGEQPAFARYPLTEIYRHRVWTYPDGDIGENTRRFSRNARPLKPPRIRVTGLVDDGGNVVEGAEVYYITYTIFEPGDDDCNEHWYDPEDNEWKLDPGSTFEIIMRLVAFGDFDFRAGDELPGTYIDGFGSATGLSEPQVQQLQGPECPDGLCGPLLQVVGNKPCDPNEDPPSGSGAPVSLPVGWAELDGFSPVELSLGE